MRRIVLVMVMSLILSVGMTACGDSEPQNSNVGENENIVEEEINTEDEYCSDKVINRFVNEYNAISDMPIEEVKNGNIKIKAMVDIRGCYTVLMNLNDNDSFNSFEVTIDGDKDDLDNTNLIMATKEVLKVLNKDAEDEEIESFATELFGETSNTATFKEKIDVEYHIAVNYSSPKVTINAYNYK